MAGELASNMNEQAKAERLALLKARGRALADWKSGDLPPRTATAGTATTFSRGPAPIGDAGLAETQRQTTATTGKETQMAKTFTCDVCGRVFDTEHGRHVHTSRVHKAKKLTMPGAARADGPAMGAAKAEAPPAATKAEKGATTPARPFSSLQAVLGQLMYLGDRSLDEVERAITTIRQTRRVIAEGERADE